MGVLKFLATILLSVHCCSGDTEFHEVLDRDYVRMPELFFNDNYDQCKLLEKDSLFCTFTFELSPINENEDLRIWNVIKNVSSNPQNYRHDRLRHGICVPTACPNKSKDNTDFFDTRTKIQECYKKKYQTLNLKGNVTEIHCEGENSNYPVDTYDIVIGAILLSYVIFVIFASLLEGIARYKNKDVYNEFVGTRIGKIVAAFSLPKNWYRLRTIKKSSDMRKLRCIQGMRFYNMMCVIMIHTVMTYLGGAIANPQYTEASTRKVLNMFLANGWYAVQTFFVISGWLISFHFFQMLEENKKFKPKYLLMAIVNRYIRLTPAAIVVIAFQATWAVHLSSGPYWHMFVGEEYTNCRNNWWTNLLYINNYVNRGHMCLQQTWYVAADTQLFVFSMLVLMVIWKFPQKIKFILGAVLAIGVLIPGIVAYANNYDIVVRQYPEMLYNLNMLKHLDTWHDLYSSGYSNIGGYTIGIIFGYIFYKYRNENLATRKIYTILWWLLSFGLCIFVVLIAAKFYDPNYKYTKLESAVYWSLGKNLFALGIAIGIFGITQKIGCTKFFNTQKTTYITWVSTWFARWFLEWDSIQVLGRLTYSTYVIHAALIRVRAGYQRYPSSAGDYVMFVAVLGDIVLSYLAGTLLCLFVEMPVSALQKLIAVPEREPKRLKGSSEKSLKTIDFNEGEENPCTKV